MDAVNYKNSSKNVWRRQVWKYTRGRLLAIGVAPKHATGIYLPGVNTLDLKIAESKGFKKSNLIAIERKKKICKLLESRNVPVIYGDVVNVLLSWPTNKTINVVNLDLQGTVNDKLAIVFAVLMVNPAFSNCVVVVNVCRGHETEEYATVAKRFSTDIKTNLYDVKHRGLLTMLAVAIALNTVFRDAGLDYPVSKCIPLITKLTFTKMLDAYKSNVTVMDSVIFNNVTLKTYAQEIDRQRLC